MPENRDCGADAAAYVLGALNAAEAEAFRRHMAHCAVCHDEVATFEAVAGALAIAAPQHSAPRRLRKRLMRSVRAAPQSAVSTGRRRRRTGAVFTGRLPRAALAGGTAVALAAAVIGGVELSSGGSGSTRLIQARVVGSAGSAQVRVAQGRAELIVRHLPPPPAGRIYEVWLKRPERAPSPTSALFSVTATGAGVVGVPGSLRGVSEVLVTPEPDGGSLVPTHRPVIVARLV